MSERSSKCVKSDNQLIDTNTREPTRDWNYKFITGYRMLTLMCIILFSASLYIFQELVWPVKIKPHNTWENIWSYGSLLWIAAFPPSVCAVIGLLMFRQPSHLDRVPKIPYKVSWRIVSRGTNIEALRETILRCRREMLKSPFFDYLIEVVVESGSHIELLPHNDDVEYIVIPKDYSTPNGSQFKARGLEYALYASSITDDTWLVHLDEETHPTSSGIKGIAQMILEEESSGKLRVGQGAILYHRNWNKHPYLTLADMLRTGDDFARFYFQNRLGVTIFGLHGSYIVCRNDVEKSIGFDFGPQGSITEDAFWALVFMELGGRSRWCDGYLEEQSTQSVRDFVRQRKRWFQGLMKVALLRTSQTEVENYLGS